MELLNGYARDYHSFTWFLTFMSKCVVHTSYKHCNTTQIARNSLSLLIVALLITVDARLLVRADDDKQENSCRKEKRDYSIEYYNLMRQAAPLLFSLPLPPSLSLFLRRPTFLSTMFSELQCDQFNVERKIYWLKKLTQNSNLAEEEAGC